MLDVGANIGQYGSRLREFGFRGKIVSFEPMRKEYAALMQRTSVDTKWRAECYALGSEDGTARINVAGNSISSSMLPMLETHLEASRRSAYTGAETIIVRRLDNVIAELVDADERVCLKVDTQGFEREVLDGAHESLSRIEALRERGLTLTH